MQTIANREAAHKGETFLIVGAGGTLREYGDRVKVLSKSAITIGINNMSELLVPTYHLWTNTGRFKNFGRSINPNSTAMFGSNIKPQLIKKIYGKPYVLVPYIDRKRVSIGYRGGRIKGYFRTAGNLAIMIAHIMGASTIYIAGMDGYTLYSQKEFDSGKQHQHVYGSGFTDKATWNECLRKDKLVNSSLKNLRDYGIKFSIFTPTYFSSFYDGSVI